jgi:hypothetical protein
VILLPKVSMMRGVASLLPSLTTTISSAGLVWIKQEAIQVLADFSSLWQGIKIEIFINDLSGIV